MKSFGEDAPDVAALKLITLLLGLCFTMGGVVAAVLAPAGQSFGKLIGPFAMLALGCYVTAASLVGLRQGPIAVRVFAPAAVAAFGGLLTLALASGTLTET